MKFTALLLALGLLITQAQFWWGRASVSQVAELRQQLREEHEKNQRAREQIRRLRAELRDLREGLEMVEEKARSELGMVEPDDIFVRLR